MLAVNQKKGNGRASPASPAGRLEHAMSLRAVGSQQASVLEKEGAVFSSKTMISHLS